jgi:hypothetical protein
MKKKQQKFLRAILRIIVEHDGVTQEQIASNCERKARSSRTRNWSSPVINSAMAATPTDARRVQ